MTVPKKRSGTLSSRARRLVGESDIAAFAVDASNRILAWNDAASELLGFSSGDVVGRDSADVIELRDGFGNWVCPSNCAFHAMAREQRPIAPFTFQIRSSSGRFVPIFGRIEVVRTPGVSGEHVLVFLIRLERRRQTADALLERLLHRRLMEEKKELGGAPTAAFHLTERQREVLTLLAEGKSTAEIGKTIGVSVNTVRHHMQKVLDNLNCHSQAEAVAVAIRHQLI